MDMDSLREQIPFSAGDWVTDKNNPTIHGYLIVDLRDVHKKLNNYLKYGTLC